MSDRRQTRQKIPGWPIAAALAVLFLYLYYVRIVLVPFVIAGAIAFILTPAVDRLHRHAQRLPRWAVALAIYFLFLAMCIALAWGLGPAVLGDIAALTHELPHTIQSVLGYLAPSGTIAVFGQNITSADLSHDILNGLRGYLLSGAGLTIASSGIAIVFAFFLGLVLLAYFLFSAPTLERGFMWLVPPEYRDHVSRLTQDVGPMLRRYFLGLAVVVFYTATMALIFFTAIFKIPHAPLLAILVGLLELVPLLGPMISAGLVVLAAFEQSSLALAIGLVVFILCLRLSIDQLVGPLVLGRAAYIHPVAVIFAFLTGAVFLGVLGLLLAVPVAATIKIVLSHYYRERLRSG
ncbi:MAG TPA: AI-2E family transporter [Stellaceae bacterium]|nr:AI-2E family transporter [Stellaceae bacterium]